MSTAAAVSPLVRLDDELISTEMVGNKFVRLAAARGLAAVPDARCLPADWFTQALGQARLQQLHKLLTALATTLGNEAASLEPAVADILDGLALTKQMRTRLNEALTALAGSQPDMTFAVRSSTTVEDGARHSHAGLYESQLHLRELCDTEQAVLSC